MTTAAKQTAPAAAPSVRADHLRDLLRRSVPSSDFTRLHLVSIHFEDGKAISTDGHRLHVLPAPIGLGLLEGTVPLWALEAALGAVAPLSDSETITVRTDCGQCVLEFRGGAISAIPPKASGMTFSPWRQVHPLRSGRDGAPKIEVKLSLTEVIKQVKRLRQGAGAIVLSGVRVLGPDDSRDVLRFQFARGEASVRIDPEISPWDAPAPAWNGRVGIQVDYLIDALAACKQAAGARANVTLRAWGELDPILVTAGEAECVVMPMRI